MIAEPGPIEKSQVTVAVLAGGQGRRMGGRDKGLLDYKGKPLIEHLLERLLPQTDKILISANRNIDLYAAYGWPVFADSMPGFQGPLAGIASVLEQCQTPFMLTVPCDSPMLEPNYLELMISGLNSQPLQPVVATDESRLQPVYVLVGKHHLKSVQHCLDSGERAIKAWLLGREYQTVCFAEKMFENINSAEQL